MDRRAWVFSPSVETKPEISDDQQWSSGSIGGRNWWILEHYWSILRRRGHQQVGLGRGRRGHFKSIIAKPLVSTKQWTLQPVVTGLIKSQRSRWRGDQGDSLGQNSLDDISQGRRKLSVAVAFVCHPKVLNFWLNSGAWESAWQWLWGMTMTWWRLWGMCTGPDGAIKAKAPPPQIKDNRYISIWPEVNFCPSLVWNILFWNSKS